jgi:hypothetical protein
MSTHNKAAHHVVHRTFRSFQVPLITEKPFRRAAFSETRPESGRAILKR